jgi:hypothetical protein
MNLDTIWQLHRKFIIATAVGLIVFMIGLAIIGSTVGKDLTRYQGLVGKHKRALNTPAYSNAQVNELRGRLTEMETQTVKLASASLPALRSEFVPSPGQSATQHYIELTGQMRSELIGWALRQNVDVDESLGLPAQSPTQPQMIARILRGLDVVERVVRMGVQTGADSITDIQIASRIPKKRRNLSGSRLDMTPVTLEVVFADQSPRNFMNAIMESADGLGPLGLVRMELLPTNQRKKLRRVVLEFAAGELPTASAEEEVL